MELFESHRVGGRGHGIIRGRRNSISFYLIKKERLDTLKYGIIININ